MVTVESCGGHSYSHIRPHGGAGGDDGLNILAQRTLSGQLWSTWRFVLTEPNIIETLVQFASLHHHDEQRFFPPCLISAAQLFFGQSSFKSPKCKILARVLFLSREAQPSHSYIQNKRAHILFLVTLNGHVDTDGASENHCDWRCVPFMSQEEIWSSRE